MKVYPKNSFDRFGDDLMELILSYLWFEDKVRLECVSKQWRRLVYNKQFVFDILRGNSYQTKDCLRGLFQINSSDELTLNRQALESVLKKCPNITKFGSNKYFTIDSEVLSLIGQYCPHIKSLYSTDYDNNNLSFFRDYGHKLEELSISETKDKIKHFLELCPNLKKVHLGYYYYENGWVVFSEDKQYLPKLEEIDPEFCIQSKEVNKLKILSDKYCQTMKTLNVTLDGVSDEELKTCIECIARFENLKELKLIFYSETKEPIVDCLSLIGQKCNKLLKLDLEIRLYGESIPISHRFSHSLSEFKTIKRLNIRFENTVLKGNIKSLKHCKELNHLNISCGELTEDFFTGIASSLPKLQSLNISTSEKFSDSFIHLFHTMKNIGKSWNRSLY